MASLFGFILLLILIAILAGFIYAFFLAYKRLSLVYFLVLLVALVATPYLVFKSYEKEFLLSIVPDALKVKSISYREEESWGFGPGGNEAGIRIYPLSEQIASEISQRGIEFFNNLPPNQDQQSRGWRGRYENWSETPIRANERWKWNLNTAKLDIYDYIGAYGFSIDIKPEVVELANEIVNSAGSYYAYGRIGLIVVCPSKKLVLYLYNG
jgi:hypothetical protein